MEYKKRCGNCGKYPFCKRTEGASYYCEEWIKRNSNEIITYIGKKENEDGNKN